MIKSEKKFRFILGSTSPRRREILIRMGYEFEVLSPEFEEIPVPELSPEQYVEHNANEKAKSLTNSKKLSSGESALILAADTIVVFQDQILEKPKDPAHSEEMLEMLSGAIHTVMTGYSLYFRATDIKKWRSASAVVKTEVTFNRISKAKILEYIKTGESKDKAGSYGIQGMGKFLVEKISGSLSNVIGLPEDDVKESIEKIISD